MADAVTCNFCRLDLARLRPEEVGLQKLQELNEKYGAELAPDVRSFHKLVQRIPTPTRESTLTSVQQWPDLASVKHSNTGQCT